MKRLMKIYLLITALAVLTVNALAETPQWKEAAEQVAQLESRLGYYDTWKKAKDKIELVRILADAGELSGSDVDKVLGKKLKDKEKAALCDKILKGKKGVARVKMTEGIAVQRLSDEEAEYLIFQNFNNREKRLPLDYNKLDIIFGYDPVPASSALVLRVPRKGRKPSQDPSAEE